MRIYRFILLISFYAGFMSVRAQEPELSPSSLRGIWDFKNSTKKFKIDTLGFSQIPGDIEYRGIIVEALKWNDSSGTNLLVLTETGEFENNDPSKPDETQRAEIYAYKYVKGKGQQSYKRTWKLSDHSNCFGVDLIVQFYKRSLAITDLDKDGVAEITIIYQLFCGGGVDPGEKKLIIYEGNDKYAMRGRTLLCLELVDGTISKDGGEFKADENLKAKKDFYEFSKKRWNVCDNDYK